MLWISFLGWLEEVGTWLLVIVFAVILLAFVGVVIWLCQKGILKNKIITVIITALGSIIFTIPVVSTMNLLIEKRATNMIISQKKDELDTLEANIENAILKKQKLELENKDLSQSNKIANLQNELDLLKSAQLNMDSLNKICQLALLETQLKQNDVRLEEIDSSEDNGLFGADKVVSEILVITTHDINAKHGVDLKDVMIKEDNQGILHVCGIKPKYIGSDKNISETKLCEIRKVEYKKSKDKKEFIPSKVLVLSDNENVNRATNKARTFETEFQNRLSQGLESNFLDDAVVKLAQNFIKLTLAPLSREIVFDDNLNDGVSILDYLNGRIKAKEGEIISVNQETISN